MAVHVLGLPADMNPILDIARAHMLVVIEDAAQAISARYNDQYVGTMGHFGCFSFLSPFKNSSGCG
jgi:dTDP-4-amino-4,6-dideoxygalactose transaminase